MNHDEYKELLSAFLDGELNEAERADVLAHLETCKACQAYLAELNAMHNTFDDLEEIDVPTGFAGGVLARLHEEEPAGWTAKAPKRRIAWRRWAGVAACAAVVLLAGSMWRFTHMGMGSADSAANGVAPASSGSSESASIQSTMTTASSAPAAAAAPEELEIAEFAAETADTAADSEVLEYMAETPMANGEGLDRNVAPEEAYDEAVLEKEAPVLTLYGEGAEKWLTANCFDNMAGDNLYVVSGEALYDLPEGLTLGDDEAVALWKLQSSNFVTVRAAETEATP